MKGRRLTRKAGESWRSICISTAGVNFMLNRDEHRALTAGRMNIKRNHKVIT